MTTPYWSDFIPNSTFYRILSGFHRTFATGVACRQGTLTPPDTWSRPFGTCICSTCWDQSFSELVVILPDYALRISLGTFSILPFTTSAATLNSLSLNSSSILPSVKMTQHPIPAHILHTGMVLLPPSLLPFLSPSFFLLPFSFSFSPSFFFSSPSFFFSFCSEMCIWSTLLIKSDLKWCIHLSRSLLSYFNYLVSVTAGGPRSPRGHM